MTNKIYMIYKALYKMYGSQGWWPLLSYEKDNGYHKGDYNFPRNENEIFEVCLGSILTQNTTFNSVIKSLNNLKKQNLINVQNILEVDIDILKEAIKPSGYFNQKTNYIINFTKFFKLLDGKIPTRKDLLNIKGIGEETADSILLYGYNQTTVKVDAYTKRLFIHLNLISEKTKYIQVKNLIEDNLKEEIKDKKKLLVVYQEFHALIVEHGKKYYSKKPYEKGCVLDLI